MKKTITVEDVKNYRNLTVAGLREELNSVVKSGLLDTKVGGIRLVYILELMIMQNANILIAVSTDDLKNPEFQKTMTFANGTPLLTAKQWSTLSEKGKVNGDQLVAKIEARGEGMATLYFGFPEAEPGEKLHAHFASQAGCGYLGRYCLIEDKFQGMEA